MNPQLCDTDTNVVSSIGLCFHRSLTMCTFLADDLPGHVFLELRPCHLNEDALPRKR
ncbi:unnamed protein product, partial [Nesidiocoris tenuis]